MFKSINNSIYEILVNIFHDKNKNSIIEPLICLVRLAILEFKQQGTKISIYDNKITYNEPNMLQGAVRWSNGDTRDDLHNIYLPITKAGEWYSLENEDIKNILTFAIRGLEKLKTSYSRNSTINHSIQFYICYLRKTHSKSNQHTNLEMSLETNDSVDDQTKNTRKSKRGNRNYGVSKDGREEHRLECDERDERDDRDEPNNTIFNKLKGIWNDREIKIINNLLIELQEKRSFIDGQLDAETGENYSANQEIVTIIDTLETLLVSKERKVYNLIVKSSTLLE